MSISKREWSMSELASFLSVCEGGGWVNSCEKRKSSAMIFKMIRYL